MVVENAARREEPVAAAIAGRDEVSVRLRDSVGGEWRQGRRLGLGSLDRIAEDLARRRLVEANSRIDLTNRFEHRGHADGSELGGLNRLVPGPRNERRSREVEDLGRGRRSKCVGQRSLVEKVGAKNGQPVTDSSDCRCVCLERSTNDAVDVVSFREEKLGQQRAVLATDPRDERPPLPTQERVRQ